MLCLLLKDGGREPDPVWKQLQRASDAESALRPLPRLVSLPPPPPFFLPGCSSRSALVAAAEPLRPGWDGLQLPPGRAAPALPGTLGSPGLERLQQLHARMVTII